MQCIDACIEFARMLSCDIEILWLVNEGLNSKFDCLFDIPESVNLLQVDSFASYKNKIESFRATHVLDIDYFNTNKPSALFWNNSGFGEADRLLIKSYHRFYAPRYGYTNLQPNANIMGKVLENKHLADGSLGVHVRRTDHKRSIEASQTADFFAVLDARPVDERFFLSTDDENELAAFENRYGKRLLHYRNRSLIRNESAAIEDALINMMLLSRCTSIVGSGGSIFSACAAFMGNLLLHRIVR
jgi:hypothetical protein